MPSNDRTEVVHQNKWHQKETSIWNCK